MGAECLRLTEHLSIGVELSVNLSARVVHDLSIFGVAQVCERRELGAPQGMSNGDRLTRATRLGVVHPDSTQGAAVDEVQSGNSHPPSGLSSGRRILPTRRLPHSAENSRMSRPLQGRSRRPEDSVTRDGLATADGFCAFGKKARFASELHNHCFMRNRGHLLVIARRGHEAAIVPNTLQPGVSPKALRG